MIALELIEERLDENKSCQHYVRDLLALARAGRRLADVVEMAGEDMSGEVMGRYDEEYVAALAAFREADSQ